MRAFWSRFRKNLMGKNWGQQVETSLPMNFIELGAQKWIACKMWIWKSRGGIFFFNSGKIIAHMHADRNYQVERRN